MRVENSHTLGLQMNEIGISVRCAALLEHLGIRRMPRRDRSRSERHSKIQRREMMARQMIAKITG